MRYKKEFEAFDESLRQKVQEAQDAVHQRTVQVTQLRKEVPLMIAEFQKEQGSKFMNILQNIDFEKGDGKKESGEPESCEMTVQEAEQAAQRIRGMNSWKLIFEFYFKMNVLIQPINKLYR